MVLFLGRIRRPELFLFRFRPPLQRIHCGEWCAMQRGTSTLRLHWEGMVVEQYSGQDQGSKTFITSGASLMELNLRPACCGPLQVISTERPCLAALLILERFSNLL